MSRFQNPPKETCMVLHPKGNWVGTDVKSALVLETWGHKVVYYDKRAETEEKPAKARSKKVKLPQFEDITGLYKEKDKPLEKPQAEKTPATALSEPDNAPSEAAGVNSAIPEAKSILQWRCDDCGLKFIKPCPQPQEGKDVFCCPKCGSRNLSSRKKPKSRKKELKTDTVEIPQDESIPTITTPEPDNQPASVPEALPKTLEAKPERKPRKKKIKEGFRCKKCGETFEEPLELMNGAFGCPKCRSLQIEPI